MIRRTDFFHGWLAGAAVLLLCSGCGSNAVILDGTIPAQAAITPIPATAGLYLEADMLTHVHNEEVRNSDWAISTGRAQEQMWRRLIPLMFTNTVDTTGTRAPDSGADLIIAPTLDEFQFSIPGQTRNSFYEVWLRYRIAVHDPGTGELIVAFPHVAYGKSEARMINTNDAALMNAANWAFRDAGAFFMRNFPRRPEIRSWLATRGNAAAATPPGDPGQPPRQQTPTGPADDADDMQAYE